MIFKKWKTKTGEFAFVFVLFLAIFSKWTERMREVILSSCHAICLPSVYHTRWRLQTSPSVVLLYVKQELWTAISVFGFRLSRFEVEPESRDSVANASQQFRIFRHPNRKKRFDSLVAQAPIHRRRSYFQRVQSEESMVTETTEQQGPLANVKWAEAQ